MNAFDYSAIWSRSGLQIDTPWMQAKDLRKVFPTIGLSGLKRKFWRIRGDCGKTLHQPIHVAEVANALGMPLPHLVELVKAARTGK